MKISIFKNGSREFQQWYSNLLKFVFLLSPDDVCFFEISQFERDIFDEYEVSLAEYPILEFTNDELATLFFLRFS
jgi:hypothetical protein